MIRSPFVFADKILQQEVQLLLDDKPIAHLEYPTLNKMLDGLHSRLIVIAGEPGTGKTTFALQMADFCALQERPVIFVTLEIPPRQLIAKSLARTSKGHLTVSNIAGGKMNDTQKEYFDRLVGWHGAHIAPHIGFLEGPSNVIDIGALVTKLVSGGHNKPVVFVDYIQIISQPDELTNVDAKIAIDATMAGLRRIVNNHDIPVIAVSSINRTNYSKEPSGLDALGGSCSIEYGADVVMFLNLDGKGDERKDNLAKPIRPITLIVLKNRYGSAGAISMQFDTAHAHFSERG